MICPDAMWFACEIDRLLVVDVSRSSLFRKFIGSVLLSESNL
jgi:hypothetical protein